VTSVSLPELYEDSILDPCCGTGNFLLQLPDNVKAESVYGCDIDPMSVYLTRINMALRFPQADTELICRNITLGNYLTRPYGRKFDHIIGNPPWGYGYTDSEKEELRHRYTSASASSVESFDLFVEKALSDLAKYGDLTFVLPKAILNVKSHRVLRRIIKENSSIERIEYLGEVFDKVNCPSIVLRLRNTGREMNTKGLVISDGRTSFTIDTDRYVDPDNFTFLSTDEEYRLLEKIKNVRDARFLLNNADFALGIVTGKNSEFISGEKTSDNEMVLKGADIFKFCFRQTDAYINFKPEGFQQVAPTRLYRAKEKLLYRFISNQLVFAYDDKQTLSLNSCNVLIPRIPGLDMKYVLAILNSSVAQFFCMKQFDSVKVLKCHIESIPIPAVCAEKQKEIAGLADALIRDEETDRESIYNKLDEIIFNIFEFKETEKKLIRSSVDKFNRFL
jgi:SAM-dependent methyltransferase